jgi:HrpA-like RNA helicase
VILSLKTIGIDNVIAFSYLERPPLDSFQRALKELFMLGALDRNGNLSEIGTYFFRVFSEGFFQ